MDAGKKREYELLELIRTGKPMTWSERLDLIVRLSIPSILAQLSVIVMLYIDASMVGSLGANASASIGLVSTTTWLFSGVCTAAATGFSVQVAHLIGANDPAGARNVLRQAFSATLLFGLFASAVGCAVSGSLPGWLGGNDAIAPDASRYFLIYALSLPFLQVNYLSGSMLRCSGNMRVPSMLSVLMCVLDVIFNTLLIFPTRTVHWGGAEVVFPGAGMGVAGAALGTALAVIVTAGLMTCYLWFRSPELALGKERGSFRPTAECLRKAVRIGLPIGCEHVILCGAQILTTVIVAPLGTAAIAANAVANTTSTFLNIPAIAVGMAVLTVVGQCLGAGEKEQAVWYARRLLLVAYCGAWVMNLSAFFFADRWALSWFGLSPEASAMALEVMMWFNIVSLFFWPSSFTLPNILRSAGDASFTMTVSIVSMWVFRVGFCYLWVLKMGGGLLSIWMGMYLDWAFRSICFTVRFVRGKWLEQKVI